jgi:prolyl oligopeptidase
VQTSTRFLAFIALGGIVSFGPAADDEPLKYPPTKRTDYFEVYHGTKVASPYHWLEADVRTSKEVADWVEAESKFTEAYLQKIPERAPIAKRLTELWNFERYSPPTKAGKYYFFSKNDGLQNQSVIYVTDRLDGEPRVLLDPNTWSKDGTVALGALEPSNDGTLVAYSISEAGSDWSIWHVMETATGKKLDDVLKWTKFTAAQWTPDGKGFFYVRYPEPDSAQKFQGLVFNAKLCYHVIGTPQDKDGIVYERPDHKEWGFRSQVSEDGRYCVIATWKGTDSRYRITVKDLGAKLARPIELIDNFENKYGFVGNDGTVLYFETDLNAPRGRMIAIDLLHPDPKSWKEVIPQSADSLTNVQLVGNLFVCSYLKDARTQVKMFDVAGRFIRDVEFPGIGTAAGFGGKRREMETFYQFTSFATPPSIYRYDLATGKSSLFRQAKVAFNPHDYEVKQVFYPSKDGTKIPMFLTHKKGLKPSGDTPTLLYGYGGFNIALTPTFSVAKLQWCEMGGIYALANIRGGGEYGKEWHQAAVKTKRQVAYDDFIAAAEWLIANNYTQTSRLAIQGGSNGGLLVGACMTQRPDLYGACLPAVGVMDLLHFHQFTAGRYWVDDYGSADDPEQFPALFKISPYHNLKPGTKYPATLVTTADTDDRVVPSHSFKFIAQLQYCQAGPAPVLARIETRAGHGAGRPTSKSIEEAADQWAFLVRNLKFNPAIPSTSAGKAGASQANGAALLPMAAAAVAENALQTQGLWRPKTYLTKSELVVDQAAAPPRRYALLTYYRYEGDLAIQVTVQLEPPLVTQIEQHPHGPTSLTAAEMAEAERIARAQPELQRALARYSALDAVEADVVAARIIDPTVPGYQHRVARLFFRDRQRNYLQFVPMVDVDLTTGEARFDLIRSFHDKK